MRHFLGSVGVSRSMRGTFFTRHRLCVSVLHFSQPCVNTEKNYFGELPRYGQKQNPFESGLDRTIVICLIRAN